jgi:hypothetical protein
MKRRQEDEERRRAEELAAQEAALAALHSPPDESRTDQYVLHIMSFQGQQLQSSLSYRTDGDTSPSDPTSASTEKEPATEATEGKLGSLCSVLSPTDYFVILSLPTYGYNVIVKT